MPAVFVRVFLTQLSLSKYRPSLFQSRLFSFLNQLFTNFFTARFLAISRKFLTSRESLSTAFLRRGQQPEKNISGVRTVLSLRFLYFSSLMEKILLEMWMWLCEGKLKVKIAHFRLPSASQKRACLSSLLNNGLTSRAGHKHLRNLFRLLTTLSRLCLIHD